MHRTVTAELPAPQRRVWEVVADLTTYPRWLSLVTRVDPDGPDAWFVTLRAKLGPLARSKRLRMELIDATEPSHVRFARNETDGRDHADWVFDVAIGSPDLPRSPPVSIVTVDLRYDGRLWSRPIEIALGSHIDEAIPRLRELIVS